MKQLFTFLLILMSWNLYAQSFSDLEGYVLNEQEEPLVGAMVVLLNPEDSVMQEFCSTNEEGRFLIKSAKAQNYLLQITYLGYSPYSDSIDLQQSKNLDKIFLKEEAAVTGDVEITRERIPIRINGDTVEYDAAAFNTKEFDDVEALLKKLPGVEVDRDGNVKAQGENVDKITVDGKEFFGNDPKIAMKNLPADAVKDVQVFDRKSKEADFTGVDDGERNKTINLKLKEDKKHGTFGQAEAGYGLPDHRYRGKLSLNYFNPKMRVSAIGSINNINERNFEFQDYIDLIGGFQALMARSSGGGGNVTFEIGDDAIGRFLMRPEDGFSTNLGGGLNGNFYFSKKAELDIFYVQNYLNQTTARVVENQSFTGEDDFSSLQLEENTSRVHSHNVTATLKNKFSSNTEMDLSGNFRWNNSVMNKTKLDSTFAASGIVSNRLQQDFFDLSQGYGVGGVLNFRQKFKKTGRNALINLGGGYSNSEFEQENVSITDLYNDNGQLIMRDSLNQNQYGPKNELRGNAEVRYTEPLGNKSFLNVTLNTDYANTSRLREFYDVVESVEVLNDSLTNEFERDYNRQQAGVSYQKNTQKTNFTAGLQLQRSFLAGSLSSQQDAIQQSYYYPLGQLSFSWRPKRGRNLRASFKNEVREPRIDQLQPALNNSNPLNQQLGNPNLVPEYMHQLRIHYNLFDQFTFTNLFANVTFEAKQNAIIYEQDLDENFRIFSRPVNTGTLLSARFFTTISKPIKKLNLKPSLSLNGSVNQNIAYVNGNENAVLRQNYNATLRIGNKKKEFWDWDISGRLDWNYSNFSLSENRDFLNYFINAEIDKDFGEKMDIGTEFELGIYNDPSFSNVIYLPDWSAEINRYFLKGNRLKVGFKVHNILNQQQNVSRRNSNYSIFESRSAILGRYFMLEVAYKIAKNGGSKEPNPVIKLD